MRYIFLTVLTLLSLSLKKYQNDLNETKKTIPSSLKGTWAVNCQNELTILEVDKGKGFLSLYSPNAIYINIDVFKSATNDEYLLKFNSTDSQRNFYADKLSIKDEEISKEKIIGKLKIEKDGKAILTWVGLFNSKKNKLEFTNNNFLLIKENGGKQPLILEKCD